MEPGGAVVVVDSGRLAPVLPDGSLSPEFITNDGLLIPVDYRMSRRVAGVEFEGEVTTVSVADNEVRVCVQSPHGSLVLPPRPRYPVHIVDSVL